jgi:hypothetical protein
MYRLCAALFNSRFPIVLPTVKIRMLTTSKTASVMTATILLKSSTWKTLRSQYYRSPTGEASRCTFEGTSRATCGQAPSISFYASLLAAMISLFTTPRK